MVCGSVNVPLELLSRLSLRYTGEHSVLKVEENGAPGEPAQPSGVQAVLAGAPGYGHGAPDLLWPAFHCCPPPVPLFWNRVFCFMLFYIGSGHFDFTVVRVTKSPQLSEDADF